MNSPMSNLAFNGMAFLFKMRDLIQPRRDILEEAMIEPGDRLLDYGCGPGGYVVDAAEMVGETGQVYALDLHPLAIRRVKKLAQKQRLKHVKTILSDCQTGLPDDSVDVVLLYDVLHGLSQPQAVLEELRRVLKPGGTLSLSDHHMNADEIVALVTSRMGFKLSREEKHTYRFSLWSNGSE